jgi:hypothetical protein
LEGVLDGPEAAGCAPVAVVAAGTPEVAGVPGEVMAPVRGAVVFALCLSLRPWLNINAPETARATSMISTAAMRPHGRRATVGIEIEGSSKRGVGGRASARRGAPFGA